MKRIVILSAAVLLGVWGSTRMASGADRVFRGEIADSQCALNVHSLTHSHQEMLKSKSMGGNATDCTLYCVKYHGGEFVLSEGNEVYRLDNQDLPRKFAGVKVVVTGTLLPDKKTIHVIKIEAAE